MAGNVHSLHLIHPTVTGSYLILNSIYSSHDRFEPPSYSQQNYELRQVTRTHRHLHMCGGGRGRRGGRGRVGGGQILVGEDAGRIDAQFLSDVQAEPLVHQPTLRGHVNGGS